MSEKYTIDNAKNDIQNLQDQNSYDFQEIKRLDDLIKDYDKRVSQAINFNNLINKKNQYDYEKIEEIKTQISLILDRIKYIEDNSSAGSGSGLTISQKNQLNTAYNHSQTKHISQSDVDSTVNNKITESLGGYTLRYLTQNEYDNLSESEKILNNVEYHITDSEVSCMTTEQINKLNIAYEHSQSEHNQSTGISTVQYSNLSNELKSIFVRIG